MYMMMLKEDEFPVQTTTIADEANNTNVFPSLEKKPRSTKEAVNANNLAARKRAMQKARDMFAKKSSGPKKNPSCPKRRLIYRSKSAENGYRCLFTEVDGESPRQPLQSSNRRNEMNAKTTLYGSCDDERRKTNRSHSDPLNSTSSSKSKAYNLRIAELSSCLLSKESSFKGSMKQGPESFILQSHHSTKSESSAPRKPTRRLSSNGSSVGMNNSRNDNSFSLNESFAATAPPKPNRSSSNESSRSSFEVFNSSIHSIEYEWPLLSTHDPSTLGSSGLTSFNESMPRKPTRRPSNNGSSANFSLVSLRNPSTSHSELIGIGNESFASIGREYIFEDPHRLLNSPEKSGVSRTQRLVRKVSERNPSEKDFHLSAHFSISQEMPSISSTALASSIEPNGCAFPQVWQCGI